MGGCEERLKGGRREKRVGVGQRKGGGESEG